MCPPQKKTLFFLFASEVKQEDEDSDCDNPIFSTESALSAVSLGDCSMDSGDWTAILKWTREQSARIEKGEVDEASSDVSFASGTTVLLPEAASKGAAAPARTTAAETSGDAVLRTEQADTPGAALLAPVPSSPGSPAGVPLTAALSSSGSPAAAPRSSGSPAAALLATAPSSFGSPAAVPLAAALTSAAPNEAGSDSQLSTPSPLMPDAEDEEVEVVELDGPSSPARVTPHTAGWYFLKLYLH